MPDWKRQLVPPFSLLAATLLLWGSWLSASQTTLKSGKRKETPKLFVITATFTTLSDWKTKPTFLKLLPHAALSLLNTRLSATQPEFSAYVPIAFSTYLDGGPLLGLIQEPGEKLEGEKAADRFQRFLRKPASDHLLYPPFAALFTLFSHYQYPKTFGRTGDLLNQHGVTACALGNADAEEPNRAFALTDLRPPGNIPYGKVSRDLLDPDPAFPYGVKTSLKRFQKALRELLPHCSLLTIELGDLVRFHQEQPLYSKRAWNGTHEKVLVHSEKLITFVLNAMRPKDALFFLSPFPPDWARKKGGNFGFFLWVQKGLSQGVLKAATTHTPGFVANVDLPPSILQFFSIPSPPSFLGSPVQRIPTPSPLAFLAKKERKEIFRNRFSFPTLSALLVLEGIGFLYLLTCLFLQQSRFYWGVLGILWTLPLFLLFYSLFSSFLLFCLALTLFSIAIFGISVKRKERAYWILLGYPLFLSVDLLRNSPWMRFSPLGFSMSLGGRYYGIGNEYMGIWLFSLLFLFSILNSKVSFFLWVTSLSMVFVRGENLGGMLTFLAAGGVFFLPLWKEKKKWALPLLLLFSLFLWLPASHITTFFSELLSGEFGIVEQTLLRKFSTNLRLLEFTRWANFLWFMMGIVLLLFWQKKAIWQRILKVPLCKRSFLAILTGAAVGFLLNDSGVVVAATGFFALNAFFFYHGNRAHRI